MMAISVGRTKLAVTSIRCAVCSFGRLNGRAFDRRQLRARDWIETGNTSGAAAMNKPLPVNPPELRSTFVAASSMPWQRTEFDGIEMKILYKDDEGRSTILFKMAPGAVVPLHEHTALEQTFMLAGSLEDSEGSVGAGDFVWRPGGNVHVAHAPNGAMFISVFNRPNRFFDGTKFFTAAEDGK
jgi:quercetin dioxygenase-like cupin family protein